MAVCLTFDDGPDPTWTPLILDALAEAGASATFFVLGPRASTHPALIERMVAEGHEVGLHAEDHMRHTELTREQIAADARAALRRLERLGTKPARWRAPWGSETAGTHAAAADMGRELHGWSCDSRDWTGDPAAAMLDRCAPFLEDGCVVLMHDGLGPGATRTSCEETVTLTRGLLGLAAERGLAARSLEAS